MSAPPIPRQSGQVTAPDANLIESTRVVADPSALRRVLLVKLSSLGDVVHALPLIEALRLGLGPDVTLAWAVRDRFAALLRGNPHLDTTYELRDRSWIAIRKFGESLRSGGFDAALDAQGLLVSGALTRLSGAPIRIGLDRNREGNSLFLTHPVVRGCDRRHIVDILMGFCDTVGIPRVPPRTQRYLADGETERAQQLLFPDGAPTSVPVAGFIVGASTADKAWPITRWAETAGRLALSGVRVALLGGPAEVQTAEAVIAEAPANSVAVNLVGSTPLPVLASVLAQCTVVIGGDSGPTHLAVAVGAPVVGLYGVTDPLRTGPQWGPSPATVLDFAVLDAPPAERRPRHSTLKDALTRIPADAAADAALALIAGRQSV